MTSKTTKTFIIKKYITASSIAEAIKLERSWAVDDIISYGSSQEENHTKVIGFQAN